jgi:DNA mismatch repair protein MutL
MPIRSLPPLLVNQIAAGEVIERPANVMKELVENSIDAGATRIQVAIEQGGIELVRVSDDGAGIPFAELPLAVAPHATSKISTAEDLDAIATMGFRGEALASIASVSRLRLVSRTKSQNEAGVIESEGEPKGPPRPGSGAVGTTIEVRNLFFNTPARRKFLKTVATEAGRVSELVMNLAMSHPGIGFQLSVDGRITFEAPPGQSPRARALAVLGDELEPELLECRYDADGLTLWGLAGRPAIARATSRHQRLFLNGRSIVDRAVQHAVKEAYRGLIEPTRHPTVVMFLEMPPSQVDVNVHPAKAEVRFRNQSIVHQAVLRALREALRAADLMPVFQLGTPSPMRFTPDFGSSPRLDFQRQPSVASSRFAEPRFSEPRGREMSPAAKGFDIGEVRRGLHELTPPIPIEVPTAEPSPIQQAPEVMQIHSSYLVTQDEQGIVIIDQHALHERVMFEVLKERIGRGNLESQRMLIPAAVECGKGGAAAVDDLSILLQKLGIEATRLGPDSVAVNAFPSFLLDRGVEPESFMRDLLEKAAAGNIPTDLEGAITDVLDMMACKAAVKAGDRMSQEELAELIRLRETVERASNCPHGRPTSLRLSIKELDRQFGRT